LMEEGIAAGVATFADFLREAGWSRDDIDATFCHQVGGAHRRLLLERLSLDPGQDFATYATLGNTGSAALGVTMAMGIEAGHLQPKQYAAVLGIGSGINTLMLALDWQSNAVATRAAERRDEPLAARPR
jgi:acyl-CoA:acyl-CoA alkyltransferase